MRFLVLLLALPRVAVQEKLSQDEIRALVEKLRSDSVEAREEATHRLLKIGLPAEKVLNEHLAREKDLEARSRIKQVLSEYQFQALKKTRVVKTGAFGGHLGTELCLFNPDGSLLVTSGSDGKVRFLRMPGCKEVASFDLRVDTSYQPLGSFSRDGTLLLVRDREGYLILIDVRARKIKSKVRLPAGDSRVVACALSADGRYAAGATYNGPIYFWDTTTAKAAVVPGTKKGTSESDGPFFFSPSGRYLAYWDTEGAVQVYETSPRGLETRVASIPTGRSAGGGGVSFTPDEKRVIAVGDSARLYVWNLETRKAEREIPQVWSHRLSGTTLVILTDDRRVLVSDLSRGEKGEEIGRILIGNFVLSPSGRYALGRSGKVFDLNERRSVTDLGTTGSPLWINDQAEIVVLRQGSNVLIWDLKKKRPIAKVRCDQYYSNVSVSTGGDFVACATVDGRLNVIELPSGKVKTYEPHGGAVHTIAVSPDGRRLATGGSVGSVRLWDIDSQKLLRDWSTPSSGVSEIQFSPDGRWMAVNGYGDVKGFFLYHLESEKVLELPHASQSSSVLSFSRDSKYLVIGTDAELSVWDCGEGKKVARKKGDWRCPLACVGSTVVTSPFGSCSIFSTSDLSSIASFEMHGAGDGVWLGVSRDGRFLAAKSYFRHTIHPFQLWDLKEKRAIHWESKGALIIPGQAPPTFGPLAFSPNGRQIAVVSQGDAYDKGLLSIREASTWKKIASPKQPTPIPLDARPYFRPSGRSLLTIGEEGDLGVWRFERGRLRSAVSTTLEGSSDHVVSADATVIVGIRDLEAVTWRLVPEKQE